MQENAEEQKPKAPKGLWVMKFSASGSPLDCEGLWHGQGQVGHCQNLKDETNVKSFYKYTHKSIKLNKILLTGTYGQFNFVIIFTFLNNCL